MLTEHELYKRLGSTYSACLQAYRKLFAEEIPLDTKSTVIVTHSGVIRSFLAAMDILPEEEIFTVDIAYGQIVKIENREFELI